MTPGPRCTGNYRRTVFAVLTLALLCSSVHARANGDEAPLPARIDWRASSSATETPAMASKFAIDGDPTTRWGGPFAGEHWLQVDLSRQSSVAGVLLHWDSGFAASYRILTSIDGQTWQTVYETGDGQGGIDYVFFPVVQARYLRLASVPLSADWGVSVFEFEPLAANEVPRIAGMSKGVDAATLWGGSATPPRAVGPTHQLLITLPRPFPTTGLEVFWGATFRHANLEGRDDNGHWSKLASDLDPLGDSSLLAARKPIVATQLRLTVAAAPRVVPAIRRLRLLQPDRKMTPLSRYEVAASRAHAELFPITLHNQQVYWTVVGVPAGRQKSIFDEFGNLEAWKGAPMVQPLWRDEAGHVQAAHGASPVQSLREGWMPMPTVQWSPEAGLVVRSEALSVEQSTQPVTLLRHRLQNTGKRRIDGELVLLVRPVQIDPAWQNGGISPIHDVALEGPPTDTGLRVNGRLLLRSLSPVQSRGAAGFGAHGEGELTEGVAFGALPTAAKARDYDGLAAAYLRYVIHLAPGETRDVVLAFPLGTERIDALAGKPEAPPLDHAALMPAENAGAEFDAVATQVAQQWVERVSHVGFTLPDHSLIDMLHAQIAYMMINQTGPAIQPGPRNYSRSFIRDGSATAEIMLRMGLPHIARDYLHWYASHAVHDSGLVSPILNDDGSVNRGFGSDIEYDSQGEFVSLVASIARLDGGAQTVREYLPKVRLALQFLTQLRDRTLVPGYLADREAPARFRGLLAPSISHEGYSVPTHSYWDDFWGLKGWHDGAWLAASLGDAKMDAWTRTQYEVLRESVAASVLATMAWTGSTVVPASADRGDYDPTSTSIALDPCGQQDLLPADALQRTFTRYMHEVRLRNVPNSLWAYTPYEIRNVLSYVRLDRPAEAIELLTTLLRDRRPVAWQEFAEVVHSRLRHPGYLGDMPHTWIGAEYVRTIIGMIMHEADEHLDLLPGVPPAWLVGDGAGVSDLPTAYGHLTLSARQEGTQLRIVLGAGLRADTAIQVTWPSRTRPQQVLVDGEAHADQTAEGILIERPFKELIARWSTTDGTVAPDDARIPHSPR